MNILLFVASMDKVSGGPPRVVAGSAIALAKRSHNVTIATLCESTEDPEDVYSGVLNTFPALALVGVHLKVFRKDKARFLTRSAQLCRYSRSEFSRIDVIHVHGVWEQCLVDVFKLARTHRCRFFLSAHGMLDKWSMKQSSLKKEIALRFFGVGEMLRGSCGVIFGSHDELHKCAPRFNMVRKVIPNGIDASRLDKTELAENVFFKEYSSKNDANAKVILFFARIHPKKGIHLLLKAFESVFNSGPADHQLWIVGIRDDEVYESSLRLQIKNLNSRENILFTNDMTGTDALSAYKYADIFILPSFQEGLSIATIEAMAFGLPVIVSEECHLNEVADSWHCGWVVACDVDSIIDALSSALSKSKVELSAIGERSRFVAETSFDWGVVSMQLEEHYGCSASL